jgi:Ti-type conjugative transfer relaxase TraA
MMEHAAQNQASKTRKCEQDCVHIELSWARGETPTPQEAMGATRSALAAQGMGNAMALVYSHSDEDYFHVHIVASKINPATRRAYDLAGSWRKGSEWAEQWERDHGGVINTRRETANELRRAIRERDAAGVLEAITRQRSTFTAAELQRAVNKEIFPKTGAAAGKKRSVELERAQFMNAILARPEVVQLAAEHGGPTVRYTTRTVLEAELHVLRAANGLKADTGHGVNEGQRAAVLAGKYGSMSGEQVQAFRHCTGGDGLALIDGQAGTGKSFAMAAIRDAYETAGHRVIGLAPTNKVAKNLAEDGFGHAKTVHSELFALNNGRTKWDHKTVVMVDEAAMLDTRLYAMVTAHAVDAGAKLILVGDSRQLSSIDRGGMHSVLKDRFGAAVLSEVRRQHKIDERRASEMLAEGNFHDALGIYEQKGAVNWTRTQKEAREELVAKWAQATAADRDKSRLVLAYTNEVVNELNVALRAVRKERGELEWKDHSIKTAHGRFEFSAGDRIRFTGTDKKMGVENNATGTIMAIDGTHLAVRCDGPKGREGKTINFDAASFDNFRHSYAGTIYAGQGSTFDQVFLYHSEHWRSAPAYVALTRHKEKTELFVARGTAKDLKELAQQVSRIDETRAASQFYQQEPIGPVRPMNAAEILAHFAGEQFERTAERMEREGRSWPAQPSAWRQDWALHQGSVPMPLRPSPQRTFYRQDNAPPAAVPEGGLESTPATPATAISSTVPAAKQSEMLDADQLAARVQWIIDNPTREADEKDERVLTALYARREADASTAPAADDVREVESTSDVAEESGVSSEQQALDYAVSSVEMTDDKQVSYSRWSGQIIGAAGQPSRPAEVTRSRSRGGGRSRSR